ncbi:secreted RxLR effector protein 161-like protein [Tanacetum coccineum]
MIPKGGGINLTAYSDSDWLGCPITRRSRTGYLLLLGGAHISWKSKKQSVVSRSSAEAKYRAMANAVSEVLWMRWLLSFLETAPTGPTPLFCDNQAVRHIANNPVFQEQTKHVEMDLYFVREHVDSKEIRTMEINTKGRIADILTKPLGTTSLKKPLNNVNYSNGNLFDMQKAKIKWLSEGDQNTPYFHSILKSRKHERRIDRICDENGKSYDGDYVAHVFVDHFKNFMGTKYDVQDLEAMDISFVYLGVVLVMSNS